MSENIVYATDDSFEEDVLKSSLPVLVDYWADWCSPCKTISPILADIAEEYKGRLKVVKFNVDEHRVIPAKYAVRGIPTLMLFNDGDIEATKVGALNKSQLAAFINSHLS